MSRPIFMILTLVFIFLSFGSNPLKVKTAGIVFYNVENLFDTVDDPSKNDNEFLPSSEKKWNAEKYTDKITKIAKVLSSTPNDLPVLIGFAEIENRRVLEDLASEKELAPAKYKVVHFDSPDKRGIDVGILYSKKKIKLLETKKVSAFTGVKKRPTRDILLVKCRLKRGPDIYFFINHWPSRYGGREKSEPKRIAVAEILANQVDSLLFLNPKAHIIAMGDFNDYPEDKSINEVLIGERKAKLRNIMENAESDYPGSYHYKGKWGYLDQFIVTTTLTDSILPDLLPGSTKAFSLPEMLYQKRNGDKIPNRTYGGSKYYGGYSDHLPIYTQIVY